MLRFSMTLQLRAKPFPRPRESAGATQRGGCPGAALCRALSSFKDRKLRTLVS